MTDPKSLSTLDVFVSIQEAREIQGALVRIGQRHPTVLARCLALDRATQSLRFDLETIYQHAVAERARRDVERGRG